MKVSGVNLQRVAASPRSRQNEYVTALAGVAALTVACWFLASFTGYGAIALIYLLGVLLGGMVLEQKPVLLAAALSALTWNFIFIPPRFTLHIEKFGDGLMFVTYFVVALAVGSLTTRLRAREHLAAQLQLAEESERLRKTLLDCVSHELKTPVAAIGAASEALADSLAGTNGELARQLTMEIQDGSRRLNRVVNNLLDMNRLESRVVDPTLEWCDVRDLLQSVLATERDALDGRAVELDTPVNLPLVLLDYVLVEQAVGKLVANAGSYAEADAPIEVAGRCADGVLTITVSDRGLGFAPGDAERLFGKFQRGDTTKTGGLGLGLSIARGFIEAHGGKVTAANRAGGGACFTIAIPARMTDPASVDST
ncbi:MAG: DUF4118 domain-containing protein [Chthoniobacterales bacterium]